MAMKGYLMQMQPFSVNDGDGIRTTIFLAGCPLHCKWCANPEGLRQHPVVGFYARLCIGCGACAAVCPKGIGIDLNAEREECVSCGACVAACPKGARKALVSLADADEIIAEAAKHQLFYRNSGGGITFSGGEATAQPELLEYLSSRLYDMGFSLDIESCGYFEFERVRSSLERMDLIARYKELGIDPRTKTIIFSNALDFEKALHLFDYCKGKINCSMQVYSALTIQSSRMPAML